MIDIIEKKIWPVKSNAVFTPSDLTHFPCS